MESTSRTLLLRLKQDGRERELAWSDFRGRYAPVIAAFARRLGVHDDHDVEDVVQEVLLGFYAAQPTFAYDPAKGRLRGYLKTCVVRLLARRSEQKQRLKLDGRPVEEIDPSDDAVERAWAAGWEREQLHRAIEQVRQQLDDGPTFHAFYRTAIGSEDAAAVAAALQMSVASVYQAKSRCVVRLRIAVEQLEAEEG